MLSEAIYYIYTAAKYTAMVASVLLLADIALMAFTSWSGVPTKLIWGVSALIVVSIFLMGAVRVRFASRFAKSS